MLADDAPLDLGRKRPGLREPRMRFVPYMRTKPLGSKCFDNKWEIKSCGMVRWGEPVTVDDPYPFQVEDLTIRLQNGGEPKARRYTPTLDVEPKPVTSAQLRAGRFYIAYERTCKVRFAAYDPKGSGCASEFTEFWRIKPRRITLYTAKQCGCAGPNRALIRLHRIPPKERFVSRSGSTAR